MHRSTVLAALLVGTSCLTAVAVLPSVVGYVAVTAATAVLVAASLHENEGILSVDAHPAVVLPLVVLWLVFVAIGIVHPSAAALERIPAFVVASAAFVLVVPAALPYVAFARASAYFGAAATVVSIPGMLVDGFRYGPVGMSGIFLSAPVPEAVPVLPTGGYFAPRAGFETHNHFSVLVLFGALAGATVLWQAHASTVPSGSPDLDWRDDRRLAAAVAVCITGLVLSQGRAALATAGLAVVLAGVYRLTDWRGFAVAVLGVAGAAVAGVIGAVFAPDLIAATGVSLAGRTELWSAAVHAIAARPAVGWGFVGLPAVEPVPHSAHNSYLRLFFVGGFVGGVAYLGFLVGVVWCATTTLRTGPAERVLGRAVVPVAVLLVLHVFSGELIFGLSLTSVLSAVVVGYAQPPSSRRTVDVTAGVRQLLGRRPTETTIDD